MHAWHHKLASKVQMHRKAGTINFAAYGKAQAGPCAPAQSKLLWCFCWTHTSKQCQSFSASLAVAPILQNTQSILAEGCNIVHDWIM